MNSSISNSETAHVQSTTDGQAGWGRFCLWLIAGAFAILALLFVIVVLTDPFDTGRFTPFQKQGVRAQGPRTANASRAKNPAFSGAIFGNSRAQMLEPAILTAKTGIPFVSLMIPGSVATEQMTVLTYFLHRHPKPESLVISIDDRWCGTKPMAVQHPFPDWLYSPDAVEYLTGLVRYRALEGVPERLQFLMGGAKDQIARPDGYWDYTEELEIKTTREQVRQFLLVPQNNIVANDGKTFPAIDRLETILKGVPDDTVTVLYLTPIYAGSLPAKGSQEDGWMEACKARVHALAGQRKHRFVVDWVDDRAENRDPDNYFDHIHYRRSLAKLIEADIAAAINTGRPRATP